MSRCNRAGSCAWSILRADCRLAIPDCKYGDERRKAEQANQQQDAQDLGTPNRPIRPTNAVRDIATAARLWAEIPHLRRTSGPNASYDGLEASMRGLSLDEVLSRVTRGIRLYGWDIHKPPFVSYANSEFLRRADEQVAAHNEQFAKLAASVNPASKLAVAVKDDGNKVRVDLLPTEPLMMISEVLTFGAKKYADHNWRKGFKYSRLLGALLRHTLAYLGGQDKDPETGLSHLAHAGCCILFMLEQIAKGTGDDDRYKAA